MYAYSEMHGVISSQLIIDIGLLIRESLYAENTFVSDCIYILFHRDFIIHAKIGQKTGRTRLCALK